jgi:hypothetical protein
VRVISLGRGRVRQRVFELEPERAHTLGALRQQREQLGLLLCIGLARLTNRDAVLVGRRRARALLFRVLPLQGRRTGIRLFASGRRCSCTAAATLGELVAPLQARPVRVDRTGGVRGQRRAQRLDQRGRGGARRVQQMPAAFQAECRSGGRMSEVGCRMQRE